ncbi:hypothetical protein Tco_1515343 [Tanacetum coccineum]
MHNNIMAAGSRDRPPMLATGRYAQWRSRFLRYIDTRPNGDALWKCILIGPYTPTIVTTLAVPATEDSPPVPEQSRQLYLYITLRCLDLLKECVNMLAMNDYVYRYTMSGLTLSTRCALIGALEGSELETEDMQT